MSFFAKRVLLAFLAFGAPQALAEHPTVTRFSVTGAETADGYSVALGSGLAILDENERQTSFLIVSDQSIAVEEKRVGPFIATVKLEDRIAQVRSLQPLSDPTFDLEGIAVAPKGDSLWVVDESRPSVLQVRLLDGQIERVIDSASHLPTYLESAQQNRGFEGLSITPSGKLVFVLQSSLAKGKKQKTRSLVTRVFRYDPREEFLESFLYLPELELYEDSSEVRISGIESLSDDTWLVLERGVLANGGYTNRVYLVDARESSVVPEESGLLPEKAKSYQELFLEQQLVPLNKRLLLNLRHYGWLYEKSEGIAISKDFKTIYISNDPELDRGEASEIWSFTFKEPIYVSTGSTSWWWKPFTLLSAVALLLMALALKRAK